MLEASEFFKIHCLNAGSVLAWRVADLEIVAIFGKWALFENLLEATRNSHSVAPVHAVLYHWLA